MIERIVLLKFEDAHTSDESLTKIAAHSNEVLQALPGVVACHVGRAADEATEGTWHMMLVVHFESLDDIPAYSAHPDHRTYVDDYLLPKLESIVAFNFEV
jgi:heme-degrading monooxygenase HmoA